MALPVRRNHDNSQAPFESGSWIAPWNPIEELERFNRQLAGFLESFGQLPNLLGGAFTPLADVEETDDAYVVEVELPGVKRDDIAIEVAGRRVTVYGERKDKERVGILRKRERITGRFHYEVTLPGDIEEDHIEAHLNDGVLTIRLPKPDHERPRRIPVQ